MSTVAMDEPKTALPSPNGLKDRKPEWLKVQFPGGENYMRLKSIIGKGRLHTVCQEAHCPNMGECWEAGTATFMILGDICTRACSYCAVTTGRPLPVDLGEPARLAPGHQPPRPPNN